MAATKPKSRLWLLVILVPVFFFLASAGTVIFFMNGFAEAFDTRQKFVLYHLNHTAIANVARDFAWPADKPPFHKGDPVIFENLDPAIPAALWIANPARIIIYNDHLDLEYGGALLHHGLSIYPEGIQGEGTLRLAPGLWFNSENGKYPKTHR